MLKARHLIPVLLVVLALLAYRNPLRSPFIFDDIQHIVKNPQIRQLWPPSESLFHSSRPVVQLSLATNYALGGLNPWGFHLFNVIVHICAALILYGVVRRTLISGTLRSKYEGSAPWLAGMISSIWLVHPLQTESVTYTIQRGESMMGLFYLLTLYCVIRSHGSPRRTWWETGAIGACALGMGCKPVMATAPLVVAFFDRAFLAASWKEVFRNRWRLYAGLAVTWLLLPLFLALAPSDWNDSAGFTSRGVSALPYLLTQPSAILHYLRLAFWAQPLCFDYGWQYGWPLRATLQDAGPELIVVGLLLVATVWTWRRKPALGFLGIAFFLILAPTSSFIPVADLVVEHRMYLSLAAVIMLVVIGAFELGNRFWGDQKNKLRIVGTAGYAALLLPLLFLTVRRNGDYASELSLWQDTVAKCPQNPRAHDCLGLALMRDGRIAEAVSHYEQALRIKPDYPEVHNNLGLALVQSGKFEEAINQYRQALRFKPDYAEAHNDLAIALFRVGQVPEAVKEFEKAIQVRPDFAEAYYNLGNALARTGQLQDALRNFEQALRINPNYAEAHYSMAVVLVQTGRTKEAIAHYDQILRISPNATSIQNNFAWLLATIEPSQGGDPLRALGLAQQVCRETGNRVAACLDTLAAAYAAAGQFESAVTTAQSAIALARSAGQTQLVIEVESRLRLYQKGHPYRARHKTL